MALTDIQLYWPEGTPSPELEQLVVADLRQWMADDLDKPEDLLMHVVTLGPVEDDGPSVLVRGVAGDNRFHCVYSQEFAGVVIQRADMPQEVQDKLWPPEEDD